MKNVNCCFYLAIFTVFPLPYFTMLMPLPISFLCVPLMEKYLLCSGLLLVVYKLMPVGVSIFMSCMNR